MVSWEGQNLKQLNPPPLICIPVPDLYQHPQGKAILFPQQNLLCTSGLGINYQAHGGGEPGEAGGRPASGVAASHALFHQPSLRPGCLSLSLSLSLCSPSSPLGSVLGKRARPTQSTVLGHNRKQREVQTPRGSHFRVPPEFPSRIESIHHLRIPGSHATALCWTQAPPTAPLRQQHFLRREGSGHSSRWH